MVIEILKNPITGEEKKIYIDGWLKKKLDTIVKPAMHKKKEDFVMIIDGRERSGKSTLAQQAAAYVDPTLIGDLSRVCLDPIEFRNKVSSSKKVAIIFDEAHRGMGSKRALSEINQILTSLTMEMGVRNLFVILVLPTFFELEKYPAISRARVLLHVYKRRGQKGFWRAIGSKDKQKLYLKGKKEYNYNIVRSKNRGRFYKGYMVDEEEYDKKKDKSFKEGFASKKDKRNKFRIHRNALLYIMNKEMKIPQKKISNLLKRHNIRLKDNTISELISRYKEGSDLDLEKCP